MSTTHYETLLVAANATDEEVRASFRRLARTYHPDIAGDLGAVMMGRINEAYDVLRNVESRAAYDRSLSMPAPEPVVEEAPAADWGAVDDNWDDVVVDEPIDRDTDLPAVDKVKMRRRLGVTASLGLLVAGIITVLFLQWNSGAIIEMGNWRLTIPITAVAALIQVFRRSIGWKLGIPLAMATLCWPLGALGVWGFEGWSDALGLLAAVALSLLGPATWAFRVALNGFSRE